MAFTLFLAFGCSPRGGQRTEATVENGVDPWAVRDEILARIKRPTFPNRDFQITAYGAQGNGTTDCTQAFAQAIAACNQAGGGRVVVPAGKFLTGPIHLKSNVNLHVSEGAEILFSQDPNKYLPLVFTRFEGTELMNYSPLIYAYEQENIAVTGTGVLNGQADGTHWWPWKGRWSGNEAMGIDFREGMPWQGEALARLREMAKNNVPVRERQFGEGSYLRPSFVEPYKCKNVLIEGVTLRNAPFWILHPTLCTNVTIQGIKIISHGPNNDGCDPESCRDVLIKDCFFDTGDDCIAIKSGRDHDGRRLDTPSENIVIQDCIMKEGHGGVVIGSEISGNVRNVFAENCEMNSPHLDRALRIKSNSFRGGTMENIYLRNIRVGEVAVGVIHFDLFYDKETGDNRPVIRNVLVQDLKSERSNYAVYIKGDDAFPVENIRLENCQFDNVKNPNFLQGVKDISFQNVTINGQPVE